MPATIVAFDLIDNEGAVWAREHATKLFGMSCGVNGDLVPAANPHERIDDLTRHRLRQIIADGLLNGLRSNAIAAEIANVKDSVGKFIFDIDRAALIANTEIRNAHSHGEIIRAKARIVELGLHLKKRWLDNHECSCSKCRGNAAQGLIDLDDMFQSGDFCPSAHPLCSCAIAIVPVAQCLSRAT